MMEGKEEVDFVVCRLCQKRFKEITNTHLGKFHGITVKEYMGKFPDAPIETEQTKKLKNQNTRGKTYEKIYGKKRAKQIKRRGSKTLVITYQKNDRTIKKKLVDERGLVCERCGKKCDCAGQLCSHHLSYDYYSSDLSNYILLCKSCHGKLHNKIRREEQKFAGMNMIKRAIHALLHSMKIPLDDPNFKETPQRVSRMYMELCSGLFLNFGAEVKDILSTVFPSQNDEMIIYKGETIGMCPHHLLPVLYKYYIGIIPNGFVLGASKPQRLVELFCSVPDLQENITSKVKDSLSSMLKPRGVFVLLKGEHMCMKIRGVKTNSSELVTSAIEGSFSEDEVRSEFLSLIKQ